MEIILYFCNSNNRINMNIGVFCSANNQIDAAFFQQTEELGRWAAKNGHVIVFGGVNQGLMECLAKAVKEAGGETLGVVPSIVEETGRTSQYNDRVLTCNNLTAGWRGNTRRGVHRGGIIHHRLSPQASDTL